MASAGLAALAVGAAAQPALKSLIAGLQMAITEPLRIGDLVVVDGHTGRVEEIRMSFVVRAHVGRARGDRADQPVPRHHLRELVARPTRC